MLARLAPLLLAGLLQVEPAPPAPPAPGDQKAVAGAAGGPAEPLVPELAAYAVRQPIVLDGVLDEWDRRGPIRIEQEWQRNLFDFDPISRDWQGPEDASALLYLAFDAEHLYLGGEVKDDLRVHDERVWWGGDCLELFLDVDRAGDRDRPEWNDDDYQICLMPYEPGRPWGVSKHGASSMLSDGGLHGLRVVGRKTERAGYTFEVRIPFANFPGCAPESGRLGINLALHDHDRLADDTARHSYLTINGRSHNYSDTRGMMELSFIGAPPAGRVAAEPAWMARAAPWLLAILASLLLIGAVAFFSRPVFEWVNTHLRSWRRVGLALIVFLLFALFAAPLVVERWIEWRAEAEFGARSSVVAKIVADVADEEQLHEGSGLSEPEALLSLLRGRKLEKSPIYNLESFALRERGQDPNYRQSLEGIPVKQFGFPVAPQRQMAFTLPEPAVLTRLYLFGATRLDSQALARPGAEPVRDQGIEIGVRMVDGRERAEQYPAVDRAFSARAEPESPAPPSTDRHGIGWEDGRTTVEQYFLGAPTVGDLLVKAVTVRVRDPDLEFRLFGITYATQDAPDRLLPLELARPSLAGPPAALFDGYPRGVEVAVPWAAGRASHAVAIGRKLDVLYLFYNSTDSRVLDSELNGVEVARVVLRGADGSETAVPIRAGVNIQYGLLDPAQRPALLESKLAFIWAPAGRPREQVELLEVRPPQDVVIDAVELINRGPLSAINLFAVTGGVRARRVSSGAAAALVDGPNDLSLAPEYAEQVRGLGYAVFDQERVAAVDLGEPQLNATLKGARYPLGGGASADASEFQQVLLAGEKYLVRYIDLGGREDKRVTVAVTSRIQGLTLLERSRRQAALIGALFILPLVLFYVLDGATRIARLRPRLTTLLVATSLAPIVTLFFVLYNVVASDRGRLREAQASAAANEVRGRLLETYRQVQRTAREVLESDLVRGLRDGAELDRKRIESYLHEVAALRPAPGLDLAIRLEVELEGGQRLRFHDAPGRDSASRFDLSENGIRYHWDQLVFLWSVDRPGRVNQSRVVVAGVLLPEVTRDLGRSTGTGVALLTLEGIPIAESGDVAPARGAEEVERIREQKGPLFRHAATGELITSDLLRAPGEEPAALLEVALPPDSFLLDVLLTRMPLDRFFFWFCVATLAAAVFMGAVATGRIVTPVLELERAAQRVARGDLEVRVDSQARGEVGRLAASFNTMTATLKHRAAERARLERAMAALTHTIELEATAEAALAALSEGPPAAAAALYRVDSDRDHLRRIGRPLGGGASFPLQISLGDAWEKVLREQATLIRAGGEDDDPPLLRRLLGEHVSLVLPLVLSARPIGVVVLHYGPDVARERLAEALPILQHLAGQIAVALENSRLYRIAVADPLTGLYVESYFQNRLAEEVDRAAHQGGRLAVLRVEVAELERLDRAFGPSGSREALLRVARALRAECREMYLVARAQNVFLVLLPATDGRTALEFRAQVLRRIEAVRVGAGEGLAVRVHAGAASFPEDGRSPAVLLDAAARDLAGAKSARVRRALESRDGAGAAGDPTALDLEPYVFRSSAMRELLNQVARVAPSTASVLLLGETGAGKEVVADLLHRWSDRSHKPFFAINCSAVPESLLEAELFGYEKGAFTGAHRPKPGQLELANGGTVFLDEVGDMPASIQAKLLRVLQDRVVVRLGGRRPTEVDVRIVAATNRDLPELMESGAFRADLYFRLKVVSLTIPPLRERREDIPVLAERFVRDFAEANGRPVRGISPAALDRLYRHDWPGNVRELRNVLQRAVLLTEGDLLLPGALQFEESKLRLLAAPAAVRPARLRTVEEGGSHHVPEAAGVPMESGAGGAGPLPPEAAEQGASGDLNERQLLLLARLRGGESIRSREYFDLVGVSPRTGLRDLNDLLDRGLLIRLGRRRAATYRLASSS